MYANVVAGPNQEAGVGIEASSRVLRKEKTRAGDCSWRVQIREPCSDSAELLDSA